MFDHHCSMILIRRGKRDNLGIIFHITLLCCDPSFELSRRDCSNEGSQHKFSLWEIRKIIFELSQYPLLSGALIVEWSVATQIKLLLVPVWSGSQQLVSSSIKYLLIVQIELFKFKSGQVRHRNCCVWILGPTVNKPVPFLSAPLYKYRSLKTVN